MTERRSSAERDSGAVLLLVLVVAIVLSLVVLALANFVAADLRYTQVVEARARSLSTAHSGIEFAVSRLRANQTLCATNAAGGGPVGLNGAPAPTSLPGSLNGSVTTITCERLPGNHAAIGGWSVIATAGNQPEAVKLDVDFDRPIDGPIFVSDPRNIDFYTADDLHMRDGDVWHRDGSSCATPLPPSDLSNQMFFEQSRIRGPICTPADWNAIFSAPPVPSFSGAVVNVGSTYITEPTGPCRVFKPGRYTGAPQIDPSTDVYFESGDYWLDNIGWFAIDAGEQVTVGHPGNRTPPSDACGQARLNDPNVGGPGATFHLSGESRLRINEGGSLEMFPRQQGDFFVSIRAFGPGDPYPPSSFATDLSVLRTWNGPSPTRLVVHGLIWTPANRVVLDNFASGSVNRLLGGVVTLRLWIGDNWTGGQGLNVFDIRPADAASDADVRLRSSSTVDGVTTTVEAVVQYRPQATSPDQRVAVTSSYVVD